MKKDLQKKLVRYSSAAGAVVAAAGVTNAQVVYTDIDPDFSHPGGNVQIGIDLDNDATFEFALSAVDTTTATPNTIKTLSVVPVDAALSAIGGETPSAYNYALALDLGNMVDASVNWIAAANTMSYQVDGAYPYTENWNGVSDKYLALRFTIGTATHYGWARLNAGGDEFTVKDYAYDATPDAGIPAGESGSGPVGVEEANIESMVHFVNQPNNSVKVVINGELTNGEITVVSTSGAIISTQQVNDNVAFVDMNGLASGIYMINVNSVEGSITKKMFVK
jgi:hypothetical protein